MDIIIFLIVLAILIIAHEFGHFIVAKKSGIRVDEFAIGFPPKIWSKKIGETKYSLNLIPFGGFVKIFGEDPDKESISGPDSHRSFVNKPKHIQAAVISAGVFFNILLAWLLISIGLVSGLPMPVNFAPENTEVINSSLVITSVAVDSPAFIAGIKAGDKISALTTNTEALQEVDVKSMQNFIATHEGEEIFVLYKRAKMEPRALSVIPESGLLEDRAAIGVSMDMIGTLKLPIHQAFWEGAKMTINLTMAIAVGFVNLIMDAFTGEADIKNISGPVGIIGLIGSAAEFGFVYLLGFTAFISINLAIINMLPFPALDGGRLFFLLIEVIKGSPIKPKIANTANFIGFVLLILLMVIVTFNDVVKLVG